MDDEAIVTLLSGLTDEQIQKAVLDATARKQLGDSDYAYIDSKGGRHLPINDEAHVRAAMARFSQTQFESAEAKDRAAARIKAAAKRYGIEVSDDDSVSKAAPVGIFVQIEKADAFEGVIYGVASIANVVDLQGDVIRPEVLRKAAHDFLARYNAINDTHRGDLPGKLVESWMDGERWHVGYRPDDIEIAKAAARGEYVGFSIEGSANRVEVTNAA